MTRPNFPRPYVPHALRSDSPTRIMRESDMLAYYQRWALAHDCEFLLTVVSALSPADTMALWVVWDAQHAHAPKAAERAVLTTVRAHVRQYVRRLPSQLPSEQVAAA